MSERKSAGDSSKVSAYLPNQDVAFLKTRARQSRSSVTSELHRSVATTQRLYSALQNGNQIIIRNPQTGQETEIGLWLE